MTKPPIGALLLCLVVVAASFLPWGTLSFDDAVADSPLGEFAKAFAKGLSSSGIEVTAWNSHVAAGSLRIPTWVVPVLAAFVALVAVLRSAALWTPPRHLSTLLLGIALGVALWMTCVLLSSKDGTVGIGALTTLAALVALLVSAVRVPPSSAV